MESLIEQLAKQSSADTPDTLRGDRPDQAETAQQGKQNPRGARCGTGSELPPPVVVTIPSPDPESQVTSSLDDLSRALLAVWPNQHDLDLILSVQVGASVLLHGVVCRPYSGIFSGQVVSPRHMLQPPPQGSHPVLIARRLLLLGAFLQAIPPCSVGELVGLSSDYRAIMSRAFNAATRLVTSNDELISSVEGIECVMIESMYLNDAGNLRRAWLANRRAMVMAQMMGLHRGASSPRMILEHETRDRIDPDYMWFRLVVSDRYLSLMLGLPQGSLESVFASSEALDGCMAMERMERMQSVAAGLILQRNSAERTDLAATYNVDKMLQETAALMPPQWWLMTHNLTDTADDAKAFEESIRFTNQFVHHHLLVQLHLPYVMLPSSIEPSYDYSKMTAANASRAIVAQFVSFRNSISTTAYCRGIDFVAFIASTTLCLAHIGARRQHESDAGKTVTVFQSLQHQRLSDRGLLERTLEVMETMAQSGRDGVAQKISSILRPLLAIENNSFKGGCYHICASSEVDNHESQCLGDTSEAFHALRIQIPYFGTIQIEHRPVLLDIIKPVQTLSEERPRNPPVSQAMDASLVVLCEPVSPLNRDKEGELASAARSAGYEISTAQPVNTDWQTVPSYFDLTDPLKQAGSANWDQRRSSFDASGAQETYLLVPGLAADVDDWALQGVDMALFNNLTQVLIPVQLLLLVEFAVLARAAFMVERTWLNLLL
ncbi:hypothetical protein DL762_007632 [Monosporascus cannonballus]|uniref:Xylanolytic transcriptional activator regulatory domain-containing protein n=1 Tax=Monosporascus cannonballus TaxID=155416 RepID=A0ABY0GYJ7_9PEZI|nr:hypothetical protein DL762_007632 [Monosporascus cannonballus]RYO83080.1 hypothetical protein DL763_007991 [Monosporascus cannonballus]